MLGDEYASSPSGDTAEVIRRNLNRPKNMEEHNRAIRLVDATLKRAKKYHLETEVVWSALTIAAEANEHGQTMEQVLEAALGEWDI